MVDGPLPRSEAALYGVFLGGASLIGVVVINLFLLIAIGVGLSWWLIRFTDWFGVVGGLLGLGGVFAWVAFLTKLVQPKRVEQLQQGFDARVLANRKARYWMLGIGLAFALATGQGAMIEVRSLGTTVNGVISVTRVGTTGSADEKSLPAGGRFRCLVWAPFASARQYRIKVKGFPDKIVTVRGWSRRSLQFPSAFYREVVLLRPSTCLIKTIEGIQGHALVVEIDGTCYRIDGWQGEAVWIGCDRDVRIPERRLERWRAELASRNRSRYFFKWSEPKALRDPAGDLVRCSVGDAVRVEWIKPNGETRRLAEFTVETLLDASDFPDVEDLKDETS